MASGRAIVSHDTLENGGWKMEDIFVRKPEKGELLVEMVASGVCHTDALIGGIPDGAAPIAFYPRILGHEGAAYVKQVGEGVHVAQPGDPVRIPNDTTLLHVENRRWTLSYVGHFTTNRGHLPRLKIANN